MKSNAEKQHDCRERKKLQGPDCLEEERKIQKENYVKISSLWKKELQERRIAVKERVQRSRDRKKAPLEQNSKWNELCLFVNRNWYWSDNVTITDSRISSISKKRRDFSKTKTTKRWPTIQKDKKTRKWKKKTPEEVRVSSKKNLSIF